MRKSCLPLILVLLVPVSVSFAQEKKTKKIIKVGVIQASSHPNFDADAKGFEKAIAESPLREGIDLTYNRQNAQGKAERAQAISQKFLVAKVDLIHSIAPLASQAAVRTTTRIPIVFSSVIDPVKTRLVPKKSLPGMNTGTNVTGVTDRWPAAMQFEMYARFLPKAKKWGTIYHANDPKALLLAKDLREAAKKLKVELIAAMITSKAEVAQAAQLLADNVQAMIIPYDDTVLSAFEAIVKVCNGKKIPLFAGEIDRVSKGAIAAYGSDYFMVGYSAGKKALRILEGEKPGEISWGPVEKLSLVVSEKAAKTQGVIISPELLKRADKVIEE